MQNSLIQANMIRPKKKKGLSHRLLPKKLSATLFFFFFFLGKIAMLMRFFFFFFFFLIKIFSWRIKKIMRLFHALQFALKVSSSRSQISVRCKRLS